jgi:hypothetical protein
VWGGVVALRQLPGQRVAGRPSAILQVAVAAELDGLDRELDLALAAEPLNERLVERGILAQPVIDMERRQRRAETVGDVQERHRVAAARHHHEQRRARPDQPALARGLESALAHSSRRTARHS